MVPYLTLPNTLLALELFNKPNLLLSYEFVAVFRCVTGTPIGRSLKDLHGLFVFIREDPYQHIRWFKNELENFRQGKLSFL